MIETLNQFALESLAESFETMAFLAPLPAAPPFEPPADAVLLSMRFAGLSTGVMEMISPRNLGKLAAFNMLGIESASPGQCDDALKELLNIFSGLTLRRWLAASHNAINLSLPQMSVFDIAAGWRDFIGAAGAVVLDVEGHIIALRVRECG